MAEREKAAQNKQTDVDQKHRVRQKEPEPSFDQFHAWDTGPFSLTETPFLPRMDKHAESLAMSPSDEARANLVSHLQQTYGNRYVQRLLNSNVVQAKLTVNAPGDIYEQEANRVADVVTKAVTSKTQRQEEEELQAKVVQRQEEEEEEEVQAQRQEEEEEEEVQVHRQEEEEEEEEQVQAQLAEGQPDTVSESIESRINNARGGGHHLSENVREPMEQAFGADFSDVRVHTDSEANLLNQQISARAFTAARDIFFRQGEYSPGSDSGKKLIAHELTHVVQQNSGQIQRFKMTKLKKEPGKKEAVEEVVEVNIETLTLDKCVEYREMELKNRADREAGKERVTFPGLEFAPGEFDELLGKIASMEIEEKRVICPEGNIQGTSNKEQKLEFGMVNSCMTIGCLLDSGLAIGAHEALVHRVPGGLNALITEAGTYKGDIKYVVAQGVTNQWAFPDDVNSELVGSKDHAPYSSSPVQREWLEKRWKEFWDPGHAGSRFTMPFPREEAYTRIDTKEDEFENWLGRKFGYTAKFLPVTSRKVFLPDEANYLTCEKLKEFM